MARSISFLAFSSSRIRSLITRCSSHPVLHFQEDYGKPQFFHSGITVFFGNAGVSEGLAVHIDKNESIHDLLAQFPEVILFDPSEDGIHFAIEGVGDEIDGSHPTDVSA
jgi:hypothetical protein